MLVTSPEPQEPARLLRLLVDALGGVSTIADLPVGDEEALPRIGDPGRGR